MLDEIRKFFMGLEDPNFLAMKLFLDVLMKMQKSDDSSKKVVDNIHLLSQYNIKFIDSGESCSYVFSEDDLSKIEYAIGCSGSEQAACHEFGHLLLDIFARGELPDEFSEVNESCKRRLLENKTKVSCLLSTYCDRTFKKITEDIEEPLGFYNRHPELRDEYFLKHPDNDEDDLVQDILIEHIFLISAFDRDIANYNKISNIIDGIFCGDNPFFLDYVNEHVAPILSMHRDEYFNEDDNGPEVAGFEEQFADYLVLRTYREEMDEATFVLQELLGSEWFEMMDKFYDKVTSRISEQGKVYRYK